MIRDERAEVIAFTNDGPTGIWDTDAGEWTALMFNHEIRNKFVGKAPDGMLVAVSHLGVELWDSRTGREQRLTDGTYSAEQFSIEDGFVRGSRLITYEELGLDRDGLRVRVYDLEDKSHRDVFGYDFNERDRIPSAVTVTPDGDRLVSIGQMNQQGWLEVWDLSSGERLRSVDIDEAAVLPRNMNAYHDTDAYHRSALAVAPDGESIATTWGDVFVLDVADGSTRQRWQTEHDGYYAGAYTDDGRLVVAANQVVHVYGPDDDAPQQEVTFDRSEVVAHCAVSNAHNLVALAVGQSLRLFSLDELEPLDYGCAHGRSIDNVAVSPDGEHVASASPGELKMWRVHHDEPQWSKPMSITGTLDFTNGGDSLLATVSSHPVRLSATDGTPESSATFRATTSVSGDESTFHLRYDATLEEYPGSSDIYLYRGDQPTEVASGSGPYFRGVPAMDRQAKTGLFIGGGQLYGWDLREMEQLWSRDMIPFSIIITENGELAAAKTSTELILLDAATGDVLVEMRHMDLMDALAFSPDGTYLAVATSSFSGDRSNVSVYRIDRHGEQPISMPNVAVVDTDHRSEVTAVDFRADGTMIATGGANGTVELHEFDPA